MNQQEMVRLTDEIVRKYYDNDIQPFLDHVDEEVLWYGPAKGQFLSGKKALLDAWANEKTFPYLYIGEHSVGSYFHK